MELPTQVFSTHSAFPGDILKCLHLLLIRDASHLLLMSNAYAISEFHSRLKLLFCLWEKKNQRKIFFKKFDVQIVHYVSDCPGFPPSFLAHYEFFFRIQIPSGFLE